MRTTCINLFLQAKSAQEIKVAIFLNRTHIYGQVTIYLIMWFSKVKFEMHNNRLTDGKRH